MNESKEQLLSAIAAAVGITAIVISLSIKGFTAENFFDSLKDLAELMVTVCVFLLAVKIFNKQTYQDFKNKFETYLKEWVDRNNYLIDSNIKQKESKNFYYMLTKKNHFNLVFHEKTANDFPDSGGQLNPKGAFLYTDTQDKQEIVFGLNKSFFLSQAGTELPLGKSLKEITEQFVVRINEEFSGIGIEPSINPDGTRITVSLKGMEKTEENARRLVDLVEFVKSMVIALA